MVKYHAPRRGSLAFRRKRAKRIYPSIRTWPTIEKVGLLGFPAYKVGMISVREKNVLVHERAMWYNLDRVVAATVLEAPPVRILGIRAYIENSYGLKAVDEAWTPYITEYELKYLSKKLPLPKQSRDELKKKFETRIANIEKMVDAGKIKELRAIIRTSPYLTGIGKKKPELLEVKIGGSPDAAFKWALENIGKMLRIFDVFEPGVFVDLIGVTKGMGFQGVVKRFGVTLLPQKSKKGYRRIGTLGPWTPGRIMYTVPRPGQLGFFRRTEFNKQILAILPSWYKIKYNFDGDEPILMERLEEVTVDEGELVSKLSSAKKVRVKEESGEKERAILKSPAMNLNPKGGWPHYGLISNDAVILRGSSMGPPKRLIFMRYPIRPKALKKDLSLISFYYGREVLFNNDLVADSYLVYEYLRSKVGE